MQTVASECERLRDDELIARLKRLVRRERRDSAVLIAHLAEVDERKLYADRGYRSMFAYCTRALGYSESAAGKRIYTARAARKYPRLLGMLESGEIHMEAVVALTPHLTGDNHEHIFSEARGKSKREVETIVARLAPRPDVRDKMRTLSVGAASQKGAVLSTDQEGAPTSTQAAGGAERELFSPAEQMPSSGLSSGTRSRTPSGSEAGRAEPHPETSRIEFSFTGSGEMRQKFLRAQQLLRHKFPGGKMEDVFMEALEALLDKKDPERRIARRRQRSSAGAAEARARRALRGRRRGAKDGADPVASGGRSGIGSGRSGSKKPAASGRRSRVIPQGIRDRVWLRDKGRCSFKSSDGKRCAERDFLEFDHIVPVARGGASDDASNIRLLCRTHNQLLARHEFGVDAVRSGIQRRARGKCAADGTSNGGIRGAAGSRAPT